MSANNTSFLWILLSLLLLLNLDSADLTISRHCPKKCGGINIPYPFGIGTGCYLNKWYEIKCDHNNTSLSVSGKPVPVLSVIDKEVVEISFRVGGLIRIKNQITSKGCSSDGEEFESLLNLTGTPFYFSRRNTLIAAGCDITASLTNVEPNMVGCKSRCDNKTDTPTQEFLALDDCIRDYGNDDQICNERSIAKEKICSGIGCCVAGIPGEYQQIVGVRIENATTTTKGGCKVAFLTDEIYSLSKNHDPQRLHSKGYDTVELGWFINTLNTSFFDSLGCHTMKEYRQLSQATRLNSIGSDSTYGIKCACGNYSSFPSYGICECADGYRGNPYIPGGCKGQ